MCPPAGRSESGGPGGEAVEERPSVPTRVLYAPVPALLEPKEASQPCTHRLSLAPGTTGPGPSPEDGGPSPGAPYVREL